MKFTGTKKIMGGLTLTGLIALTGIVGFAQQDKAQGRGDNKEHAGREWKHGGGRGERGMKGGGFAGRFAEKLNLTDTQKEQMQQIAARHQESRKALRQQGRTERRGGGGGGGDFGGFNGGAFDENAVRAAAQARANAHVEMEVAHARMMNEMYNVLTAEQKAQLAAERQQWEQKRQERRARRQGNSGQQIQ